MLGKPGQRDFDCVDICERGTPNEARHRDLQRRQGCGFLAPTERDHYENDCCSGEPSDGICPAFYFNDPSTRVAVSSAFTLADAGIMTTLGSPAVLIEAASLVRHAREGWRAANDAFVAQGAAGG